MGVTVREKPAGSGTWWVFISHAGRRKSKKIGTDEDLARQVAEKIKARLVLGDLKVEKLNVKGPKFMALCERYLALPHNWKESTRENYAASLKKHIYPAFADRPVETITRKEIKAFFDELAGSLKLSTLQAIRAPFRAVMAYALDGELIEANPFEGLKFSYLRDKAAIDPLNEAEAQKLLEVAKAFMGGKYYPVILLALRTGLRIGEIQALRWQDLDLDGRSLEVCRSWRKGRTTDTKSHRRRRVDLSPMLCQALKEHRISEKKKALKAGRPGSEHIFTGERDELLNRVAFQNALNRCTAAAGLRRIRTHDLRHSYATIRLMRGHNAGDVAAQLGHSSIKITFDNYVHWIPGRFKAEIDELDQMGPAAPQVHPDLAGGENL